MWWYPLTFMFSVMSFKYLSHVVLFWILKYTNALLNLYLTASNTRILCCCGAWYYCVTHLQLCHEKYNIRKTEWKFILKRVHDLCRHSYLHLFRILWKLNQLLEFIANFILFIVYRRSNYILFRISNIAKNLECLSQCT